MHYIFVVIRDFMKILKMEFLPLQSRRILKWGVFYSVGVLLLFFYYLTFKPIGVKDNQLLKLKVKIDKIEKTKGGRDINRFLLHTSEHKCWFGVEKNILIESNEAVLYNTRFAILKIKIDEQSDLKVPQKIIKIFHLETGNQSLFFNAEKINKVEFDSFCEDLFGFLKFFTFILIIAVLKNLNDFPLLRKYFGN